MRAGKRDRRITIERATPSKNAANETIKTWNPVATVWAQKLTSEGTERVAAQEIAGEEMITFRIRYRRDVTIKDRIRYDGRIWNITDVPELGRRVGTEINCVSRAETDR